MYIAWHKQYIARTAVSQTDWLQQNVSWYGTQPQTVLSVMHKYMTDILKKLEAKGSYIFFLRMRSTYLNACFENTILLELEATAANCIKHKTINRFMILIHSLEN